MSTVKRLRILLGTFVAVEATSPSATAAEAAVEAAFVALTRIGERLHPHSADSELSRINNAPLQTGIPVHPSTRELLQLAQRLNTLTHGVFDPCLPSRPGRLRDIEVSNGHLFCHAPVALDFGGFAKGYAVDCAIEALTSHGCTAGLVNAGGDLRVFGERTEPILLRGAAGELTQIELADAALAVSDADSQRHPAEHQGYYIRSCEGDNSAHDMGSGDCRDHRGRRRAQTRSDVADARHPTPPLPRYAAVIAKEAVVADALTKCVLLCPNPTAAQVLKAFAARLPPDQ